MNLKVILTVLRIFNQKKKNLINCPSCDSQKLTKVNDSKSGKKVIQRS